MKYKVIKKCLLCNSILEVEEYDILINDELNCFFVCPLCNYKNILMEKELPRKLIINKLDILRKNMLKYSW